ncbi:thioredoxin [Hymenobacter sp. BT635]|uniref:Thioredoxin n=1 Tax=Hymenobacter nitidus TaxID=2880929 RepID=A0ABS8A7P5_9BACT|nr:thioredoxin [Hymenobacter nitidus]MCB2376244.1 thioredoxin [Hymenobacter nitidus]
MTTSTSLPVGPAATPVLLVLLPVGVAGAAHPTQTATNAFLHALQHKLGAAIRVMRIQEAHHPAVVRSFQLAELPALVLVQQGVELWRHQGLPDADVIIPLLLSKLQPSAEPVQRPIVPASAGTPAPRAFFLAPGAPEV